MPLLRRHRRAWLRRPWAAGPGRATHRHPDRLEAAARPAGPGRASSQLSAHQAPLVWRAPEGPEGTGGLRGAAPNDVRPPSLAGGRARPGHSQPQASPDWRPPRGLRGLAGLRADAPSEARGADGERAGRPRGGRRSVGATSNKQGIQKRPPGTGWAYLSRLWESNPRPIHYE